MNEQDQENEGELADLDADIEHEQRERNFGLWHADGRESACKAKAVEQAADSIIIADDNGVIVYVNPAFERISGYTKEEIQAQGGWESLIYPDDMHIPMAQFEALFRNEATDVEYRIVSKAGEIR